MREGGGGLPSEATGYETQRQRRQVEGSPLLFGLVERVDDGPKYTFYFSDRPYRIAGSLSYKDFIKMMIWTPAPNAAITLPGANSSEDTLIVELTNPKYDAISGNLSYTAKIVKNYQNEMLSDFLPDVDAGIHETFGTITLFIDNQNCKLCCPPWKPDGNCGRGPSASVCG